MSGNDPFFDAWVRDKLNQVEARTPEHLWDIIRKRSRTYGITERNKYFVFVALLLITTGGIGYWAFHPTKNGHTNIMASPSLLSPAASSTAISSPTRSGVAGIQRATLPGLVNAPTVYSGTNGQRVTAMRPDESAAASGSALNGSAASGSAVSDLLAGSPVSTEQQTVPDAMNSSLISEDFRALHLTPNAEDLSLFSAGPATATV